MVFSTSVHAERQGPSMITRWPDLRSWEKKVKYGSTTPPELEMIRTSADAGPTRLSDKATYKIDLFIDNFRSLYSEVRASMRLRRSSFSTYRIRALLVRDFILPLSQQLSLT
jgi:hypothetical protein